MHRVIGFLLAFTFTAAAAEPLVMACAITNASAHRCCTGERIGPRSEGTSECCVARAPDDPGTPATARVEILPSATGLPTVVEIPAITDAITSAAALLRSPPRAQPVDLPTLFSTLLI